jgi:hypothetical protein
MNRDYPLAESPNPGKKKPIATKDSSAYYGNKEYVSKLKAMTSNTKPEMDMYFKESDKAKQDRYRQKLKGKPGYDSNGFPIKNK